jgi:hypothetical protein
VMIRARSMSPRAFKILRTATLLMIPLCWIVPRRSLSARRTLRLDRWHGARALFRQAHRQSRQVHNHDSSSMTTAQLDSSSWAFGINPLVEARIDRRTPDERIVSTTVTSEGTGFSTTR